MVRMPPDALRLTSFLVYLASWLALAIVAVAGALPSRSKRTRHETVLSTPVVFGTVLQALSALPISLSLSDGPLRPAFFELIAALVLAPLAVLLFGWSLWSGRKQTGQLITSGPYSRLRHPIYLAFLAMLLATGVLVSARAALVVATILYVTGTELRVRAEEAELDERFPKQYARYRSNTRWAYLPGLR
jgi:protein-S-isoprenylcysteine O-methyltransferase Ste14